MYWVWNFPINQNKCIVFILILICIFINVRSQLFLSTLRIQSPTQSFTVPYNKTLTSGQLHFAYFIEYGTIYQTQFRLEHIENETNVFNDRFSIKFNLEGANTMNGSEFLQVKVLVSSFPNKLFTVTMIQAAKDQNVSLPLPFNYDPSAAIKSLQAKVFPTILPMTHTSILNQTHLIISPTHTPSSINTISYSVMIITREFLTSNIGLLIDNLQLGNLGWIILFNNDIFFNPSVNNMLVGLTGYKAAVNPVIDMQNQVDYQFSFPIYPDQRSVFIFYDFDLTTPTVMTTTIFMFSETFTGCGDKQFLSYTDLYYDSPLNCQLCHLSCLTCISTNYSLTLTDENSCLTCSQLKYFEPVGSQNSSTGKCICYPGLQINTTTQECIPCSQQCLGFTVYFMRSSTQSLFLLTFSSITRQMIPIQENLRIYVNNNFTANVSYKIEEMKTNFYSIIVNSDGLRDCESQCEINFTFIKPWNILKKDKYESLTETSQSLQVQNYYSVGDKIPDQINQAFSITSMLVGAAASGGLSSVLKMLFQLQQMIEFHKYLHMELPLIFKEFIESLSIFKFLDVTTLIPFDIDKVLQSLSTDEFDTKGPIKSIYYQNGSNFYKNIVPVILSFGIVIVVNLLLFLIIRLIPFKICWKLSQKLKVRAIITFSDLLQTLILPTIVYAHFQLFITHYRIDIIWIYILTFFLVFAVLCLPFVIITYVYVNRHKSETKAVYQDLMQDCNLNENATYVFYFLAFYRKIMFGFFLMQIVPRNVQGSAIIVINSLYFLMIVYIIARRIFNSKLKMLTKTLNALCVIGIEGVMIYYNQKTHPIQLMLDLGASCVYLAIIATIAGVVQAFIKLFEIIFQNVKQRKDQAKVADKSTKKNSLEKSQVNEKDFASPKYDGVNDRSIQKILPTHSIDSFETNDFTLNDNKSLWNRPKKKLSFLSKMMNREKDNNSSDSTNTKSFSQENKQQIYAKRENRYPNSSDLISMDSKDDLAYQIRNKNSPQVNKSSPKLGELVKRFNSNSLQNDPNSYNNSDQFSNNIQRRSRRKIRGNRQSNQLKIQPSKKY